MKEAKEKDDQESSAQILKLRTQLSAAQEQARTAKELFEDQLKEV